jgi:Cd(II)/Pb(II)-responsive transcriptional regulator
MRDSLKIGELAQRTGCLVETIRYYEREDLVPEPIRSKGNYRLYTETDVERVQFILHCRSLDMTLEEIRRLLRFREVPNENCTEINALLDEHIGHVSNRIAELKLLQKKLKALRSLCQQTRSVKDCGILRSLGSRPKRPLRSLQIGCQSHRTQEIHR